MNDLQGLEPASTELLPSLWLAGGTAKTSSANVAIVLDVHSF
jgi:hypothetical protein